MKFYKPNFEEQIKDLEGVSIPEYARVPIASLNEGETILRILPPWNEKGLIFKRLSIHWFGNQQSKIGLICRKTINSRCFICDTLNQLIAKEVITPERAKIYWGKARAFCNAIDLTSPESLQKGVQIFSLPLTKVAIPILEYIKDPDYGDFTDPERGYAFKIKKIQQGMFPDYQIKPLPKKEPIPLPLDQINLYDLDDYERVWKIHSYEEQRELWEIYSDLVTSPLSVDNGFENVSIDTTQLNIPKVDYGIDI